MSGFNFNLRQVLKEAAEKDKMCGGECELDHILSDTDLQGMLDDINPISGEVAGKLQEQMSNPKNLRIVYDENANQFYMEYNELVSYCEATGMYVKDAVASIIESHTEYKMITENFNIVFPSKKMFVEACEGGVGYQDIAWSSHLLGDCKNAGLKCTTFVDPGQGPSEIIVSGKDVTKRKDPTTDDPSDE